MKVNLTNQNFTNNYVANLLKARGVLDIQKFLYPTKDCLQNPNDFKNIGIGAALYLRVVQENKRILIIVDSDCDGFTSAAIIYQYTKRLNPNCSIDYWLHEGKQHGLQDHINRLMLQDEHYDLIILPDSSSNDAHYHDMLDGINIPCLILDHHLIDCDLSDNAIVINNQLSPNYLNKELTGAGVVYQFCRFIDQKTNHNWANDYIDLAALGIIGDMGSMLELENRYISTFGLSHIKNPLLIELINKQAYSITGKVGTTWDETVNSLNSTAIAFYIVPLINAVIRVGTMEEKEMLFSAFLDGDRLVESNKRGAKGTMVPIKEEAVRIATNVKARQQKLKEEISEQLETKIVKYDLLSNKILFIQLTNEDVFPSELNGLIAMQMASKYKRPTIIARLNDQGYNRGSARGLNESALKDLKQFVTESKCIEYAAGHANAFGISIPQTNLAQFIEYANEKLQGYNFNENCYDVNFVRTAQADDLSQLIKDIGEATSVWGQNNSEPLIYITNLYVKKSDLRVMGQNKDTLKIESNGISYIKFRAKDLIEKLNKIQGVAEIELVGRANLNNWMGRISPQIFIEDIECKSLKQEEYFGF